MPNSKNRKETAPPLVVALAYDGLCTFEFGIAVEMFGLPRPELPQWYRFEIASCDPGPLRATGGLYITPSAGGLRLLAKADTIVIPGWKNHDVLPPQPLLRALRRAAARGARLVSICSGVFVLAATGLLDGRAATTHWRYAARLSQMYPAIQVNPDILYTDEGNILTSAGSAAGIDLCMHIIRKDFGVRVANTVARRLVIAPHREGGQIQFIDSPMSDEGLPWLSRLFGWIDANLNTQLTIDRLAARTHMSHRSFSRKFHAAVGSSPGEWVISRRVKAAKDLLEAGSESIEEVAVRCGFADAGALRQHFNKRVGTTPRAYRNSFGARPAPGLADRPPMF